MVFQLFFRWFLFWSAAQGFKSHENQRERDGQRAEDQQEDSPVEGLPPGFVGLVPFPDLERLLSSLRGGLDVVVVVFSSSTADRLRRLWLGLPLREQSPPIGG